MAARNQERQKEPDSEFYASLFPIKWDNALTSRCLEHNAVNIGVDWQGVIPRVDTDAYDLLLTTATAATKPWVSIDARELERHCDHLSSSVNHTPLAAATLVQLLRCIDGLSLRSALEMESLAYSMLLGSAEFSHWLGANDPGEYIAAVRQHLVLYERTGQSVTLTLNAPDTRNAMTAEMRDALFDGLLNCVQDPTSPLVTLRGAGRCFSTGGALAEFGTTPDIALAHLIRTQRSAAILLAALGDRGRAHVHGACIGSGIEVPAAAHYLSASSDFWAQLPELSMGLIPGAGGTATLSRRIGRHRACWLILSGKRIGADRALDWGLIDEIRAC